MITIESSVEPPSSRPHISTSLETRPVGAAGRPRLAAGRDGRGNAAARRPDRPDRPSSRTSRRRPIRDSSAAPGRGTSASSSEAACPPLSVPTGSTSAWDQNAGLYALSPAAAVAEEVAAAWLVELLDLPAGTSVGFVTGATMANFTALAAARHGVLDRAGWDVERHGLQGAPPVTVVTHEGSHVTVYASLQMLGLGREGEGVRKSRRRRPGADACPRRCARSSPGIDGPAIVCAQAGNVNTGGYDPLAEIIAIAHERGAWVHVDGAFGIWAAAVPVAPAPHGRLSRRRFVVDRRAQVAERAV